ncbi:MAG: hypothetical protein R2727_08545 [Bacteroidales bacterium]
MAGEEKAVAILTETFENNPGSAWLLRNGTDRRKGIRRLCNYVFIHSKVRNGAFISDNGQGIALCYRFNKRAFSPRIIHHAVVRNNLCQPEKIR